MTTFISLSILSANFTLKQYVGPNLIFSVTRFNNAKSCFPVLFRTYKDFHNRRNNNILTTPHAMQETKLLVK